MFSISEYLEKRVCTLLESSSPTSDQAIYYKIGLHKYNWKSKNPKVRERLKREYGCPSRSGIISFARDTTTKLLPDSQEIIHRDKWDLDGLIGETEYQLMHPHYWTLTEYIKSSHKRKHDVLTIFECSNSKPYVISVVRKRMFLSRYGAFTDNACISNPGIIPLEHSQFYPYRYDEWDHFAEKPDIAKKYTWVCAARFLAYVKKLGYKHVIVVMQTPYTQAWAQMLYDKNIEGCQDWLHIVNNPAFDKKMVDKYKPKFKIEGLVHNRFLILPETTERYQTMLRSCLSASDQKDFDELKKILDIESNSKRKEALAEFNKEHDANVYDPTQGTSDTYGLKTPDSDTSSTKVSEYESYIKKQLEDIEDRYKEAQESKEWHKHRVVFTVLDMLMDKNKEELIDDPDTEYWNMFKAVENVVGKDKNYHRLNSYCWVYEPLVQDITKEKVQSYTNKLGITAFNDERRRSPDK